MVIRTKAGGNIIVGRGTAENMHGLKKEEKKSIQPGITQPTSGGGLDGEG